MDTSGRELGTHQGHQHFTIGQRRGLGVAVGIPLYVIDKNAHDNTVVVGDKSQLMAASCRANQVSWHVDTSDAWISCQAQIRAHGDPMPARVRADGNLIEVEFTTPQEAAAPGQAVVCYDQNAVICGGWIEQVTRAT